MNTPKATKRYYFAYGSNCNLEQMEYRCPRAKKVEAVTLRNYALSFNGRGGYGGVANVRRRNGSEVAGLLWEITPQCERSLDRYEGYPRLYEKKNITVYDTDGVPYKAMVYVMTADYQEAALPSKQYYNGILEGFESNGIPLDTLQQALHETAEKVVYRMEGVTQ